MTPAAPSTSAPSAPDTHRSGIGICGAVPPEARAGCSVPDTATTFGPHLTAALARRIAWVARKMPSRRSPARTLGRETAADFGTPARTSAGELHTPAASLRQALAPDRTAAWLAPAAAPAGCTSPAASRGCFSRGSASVAAPSSTPAAKSGSGSTYRPATLTLTCT
ncbi:hypothetical protein emb_1d0676 [Coriobacteriaceae bacterium EMTCatB1]|nr:hypothetical protein emb_1d0676 [Coriobacteriaceae bacterium EMTCatB1]